MPLMMMMIIVFHLTKSVDAFKSSADGDENADVGCPSSGISV